VSLSRIVAFAVFAVGLAAVVVGRASAPPGRYTIGVDTVYDTKTKLTWQRTASPSTYTQPDAVSYCATLGLNGATWRLPTMKELLTIVDLSVTPPGPTIDASAFPDPPNGYYWSVTPYTGTPGSAWSVLFMYGFSYGNTMTDASYARCVR
jgi:Protein of unknown function (DUF1566)